MSLLIEEKIDRARSLLKIYHAALLADKQTDTFLSELVLRARLLSALMVEFVIPPICVRCGSGPGGGCCSPEMGNDCDSLLVLMNLLAGRDVAVQRRDGIECFFLGPAGCILLFKPFFCLNYNCRKIKNGLAKDSMSAVEMHTGRLLFQQYLLEQHMRDFFRLRKVAVPG
jgi:hypothetical protein